MLIKTQKLKNFSLILRALKRTLIVIEEILYMVARSCSSIKPFMATGHSSYEPPALVDRDIEEHLSVPARP